MLLIKMGMSGVELNVYDWNHSAIRCYDKVGFVQNPGKEHFTKFGNKNWQYFNMVIDKNSWSTKKLKMLIEGIVKIWEYWF